MEKTVFTFGRLNPPTVGHEKLVDKVKQVAKRLNAEPHVFLSHSQNSKKDPLNYNQKFKYAKQAFGNIVTKSTARTVIEIMKQLEKMNHKDVIMVVGSDRVQEFRTLLNKYNGKEYNFNDIKVVSAGERDPDAEGVSGMSASKMRAAASEGDAVAFLRGVPSKLSTRSAKTMYNDLRSAMNIKEDFDNFDWDHWAETVNIDDVEILDEAVLSYAQRIKRARNMKRLAPRMKNLRRIKKFKMADKDRLQKRARKMAISMFRKKMAGDKGEHYAQQSTSAKISIDKLVHTKMKAVHKLAQRLLPKVRKAEMERLRKARQHNESLEEGNKAQLGIPANATNAQLRKIRSSDSSSKEQKQRAHWLLNMRKEEDESIDEKCWDGYKAVGGKMKNGKMVPNCVPEDKSSVPQDKDIEDRKGTQPKKYFKDLSKSTKTARDAHFKKYAKKDDSDPSNYKPAPGDKSAETKPSVHTKKYKKMFGESNGQTDDVADIVPDRIRISMISGSKKRMLNDKFEKLSEVDIAARVSGPSTDQAKKRHSAEKERQRARHKQERDRLKARQDGQINRSQIRDIRSESLDEAFESFVQLDEKQIDALKKKAEKSGISYGTLKKVYDRGMAAWKSGHRPGTTPQQWAFARVNSFVTKSKGTWGGADKDLASKVRSEEGGAGKEGTDELTRKYKKDTPGEH